MGEIPYVMWKAAGKRLIYVQWKAQTSVYILYLTASGTHSVATLANRVQNIFDPNLNISKVTLKLILLLHIYLTTNITNTDRRATIITWDCTPHNKWLEIHKYWMTSCTRFMCVMMCLHIFFVCNVHNVLFITWILYGAKCWKQQLYLFYNAIYELPVSFRPIYLSKPGRFFVHRLSYEMTFVV